MSNRAIVWVGLYVALVGMPLVVGAVWPGAAGDRAWAFQFGIGCGFTAFTLLALEFAMIARIGPVAKAFGMDALLELHKKLGVVGVVLLGVHAVALVVAGYPAEWYNPWNEGTTWAVRWGVIAAGLLVLLVGLTVGRKALGLAYQWWQWSHGMLAKGMLLAALAHMWLVGGFSAETPMRWLVGGYVGLIGGIVIYFEVVRPLRQWMRPWEVVENRVEAADTRTLVLRPVGHAGFDFAPGQFAWLNTGATPFSKDSHPISMATAPGREVGFTIKDLGDWSGTVVPRMQAGDRVWVDGPYGVFTPEGTAAPGFVLIGGGVGVTPLVSMCETFAARGDERPVIFFYGSQGEDKLRFRGRLDELASNGRLKVVYALEEPPPGWTGETGYLDAVKLRRHLPEGYTKYQFFICGPGPMMDAMERALETLGIPGGQIHTERFNMV